MNTFRGGPEEVDDKTYRRDWAQELARQKLREMRGSGLSDVKIGERLGNVTGVFIGAILRKEDPKPVSKKVWDALVEKEGLRPVPGGSPIPSAQTDTVSEDQSENATIKVLTETLNRSMQLLHEVYDERRRQDDRIRELEAELRQRDGGRPRKAR